MWEPDEIRLLRWFLRFAGVGILVPGIIYAISWTDAVKACSLAIGMPADSTSLIPRILVGFSVGALAMGGVSYIFARYVRIGSVLAIGALTLGSVIHYQWAVMMHSRLAALPETLSTAQHALLKDTILFAANAQIPHIAKNAVLIGLCAVFFVLSPRICGSQIETVS